MGMKNTTWTMYRTGYVPASDTSGAKILVMNLETNHGRHQAFDWEVGGGEPQHLHAVMQAASGSIVRVERGGNWSKEDGRGGGYYYAVEKVEED
jgi:hypothetical protein